MQAIVERDLLDIIENCMIIDDMSLNFSKSDCIMISLGPYVAPLSLVFSTFNSMQAKQNTCI